MKEQMDLVRAAFAAYARGDAPGMLVYVADDLEWTFLDPAEENPQPRTCRGVEQLRYWVTRRADQQPRPQVEEVTGYGDRVLVVTHMPGLDERRARKTGDRNFHVVTIRDGKIAELRACRSKEEALGFAGQPA
jgi:ketosteroid isomerase-like protein